MQCINCDHHLDKKAYEFQACQTCGHPISMEEREEEEEPICPFCKQLDFFCTCSFDGKSTKPTGMNNIKDRIKGYWKTIKSYFQRAPSCTVWNHDWQEEYYGVRCKKCGQFHAHGHEPWMPDDDYDLYDDDENICRHCGYDKYDGSDAGCEICCPHLYEDEENHDDDELPF